VPPPLPPRRPSFAASNTPGGSAPGGTYSYSTGISYSPRLNTPHQPDYAIPAHDIVRQTRFANNQQAESECYLYPRSYRDSVDPRDLQEKAEKEWSPPLQPSQSATIATRGEHFAQPVAARRMAPPSLSLDPVMDSRAGTEGVGMPTVYRTGEISQTHDSRTQSTQSIVTMPPPPQLPPQSTNQQPYQPQQLHAIHSQPPPVSRELRKRKLLLIYIHGFLGSTTSFNEFPKHLHTLLTCLLSTSCPQYTVHTKIYPRFKTRHAIADAAEMFSQWLSEFEDEDEVPGRKALRYASQGPPQEETDVILLGHSMGGLLAGEIVLLPRLHPVDNDPRKYRHRILGLVGFDAPFLGMHPGVVTSGISSLFRASPKQDKRKETTSLSPTTYEEGPSAEDLFLRKKPEHFDTGLAPRSDSGNRGIRNFLTKYSGNIPGATVQYVMSHMEFAACLADPMGLSTRYRRLRGLEDGKEISALGGNGLVGGYRVRFVNYYTVCYGRDKEKEKERREEATAALAKTNTETSQHKEVNVSQLVGPMSSSQHKRVLSNASVNTVTSVVTNDEKQLDINGVSPPATPAEGSPRSSTSTPPLLPPLHSVPVVPRNKGDQIPPRPQSPPQPEASQAPQAILNLRSQRYSLPPIPPPPVPPPLHEDLSHITDQRLQKLHMKENKRLWKEHWRREKAHSKLIKEREKVLLKLEGKVTQSPKPTSGKEKGSCEGEKSGKLKKERVKVERREKKFCLIPKEAKGGNAMGEEEAGVSESRDETWVKVPMGNVDEVGAHCGLFMAGAEIFEPPRAMIPREVGVVGGTSGGLVDLDAGGGRQSMDVPQALPMDDDDRRELEAKRRQYERLVGDLAERIEGWVKEHVGGLQAMEIAGQGLNQGREWSADQKWSG